MAEIAKISRENELIKAQLRRAGDLGSAVGGGPDSEQRRQSPSTSTSSSTGRLMLPGVVERSPSAPSSTGRSNHQGQVPEGELLLTQVR